MKNRILIATLMLFACIWSTGITRHLGAPGTQDKTFTDKAVFNSGCEPGITTGIFYFDKFLSLPHPAETFAEYVNTTKTCSLNMMQDIWTKGIKEPFTAEYEYLADLGNTLCESLNLGSLLNKAIGFTAIFGG